MPARIRVNKVVYLIDDLVFTKTVRINAADPKYAPELQDILLEEGHEALIEIAKKYFLGFARKNHHVHL